MQNTCLPGTLWINRGRWNWRVKLPGETKRKNYPLYWNGQKVALAEAKGRDLAESLAWRIWERATKGATVSALEAIHTLDSVIGEFLSWADTYYRRADGTPTREAENCEYALRDLRAHCGKKGIDDVVYEDILQTREILIASGLSRPTINQRVGIWKRFFAWALENRKCQATTKAEVWAITSLKKNRTPAPEGRQVQPVSHYDVKHTLPYLTLSLAAMVQVHELTGMRPGEICAMRACDIEIRRTVWVYRPAHHKTAHKDKVRVVVIGPRAQALLSPYMHDVNDTECIFSPMKSQTERKRKSACVKPCDQWAVRSYSQAIRYATRAARRAGYDSVSDWSPNQLRHACGTRVRRKFGVEAAKSVLGHSGGNTRITDQYTRTAIESEIIKAASRAMIALG